jgi:proteasome accessory factor B
MSTQGTIKRYTLIIQKVATGFAPSFTQLQEYLQDHGFEISHRTLQRDIDQIRTEYNIKLEYNRTKNGYIMEESDMVPSGTLLRFLEMLGTAELFNESIKNSSRLLEYISFEDQGNLKGIDNLRLLLPAIINHRIIEYTHVSFETDKKTKYTVKPYLLKEYQNRWYIFGTINNTNEFRTFGLDRIEELVIKTNTFKPIKDCKPKSFFNDVIGLYYSDYETEDVILKVHNVQLKYLKALPLHHSQIIKEEHEGYALISYHLKPNYEFKQKIMMMGERASIIKPKWLATEIKNQLKAMLKQYGN